MGIENHPAGKSRGGNPFLPHSQRENVIPFPRRAAPPTQLRGGVPVGTSVQIQEWVGDDPVRAAKALERERLTDKPRVTLVNGLTNVLKRHGAAVPEAIEPAPVTALPAIDVVPAQAEIETAKAAAAEAGADAEDDGLLLLQADAGD